MTLAGDNGLLTRTVGAKNKTTLAVMEEELNLAYMSVYTGKAGTGAINSGVSLDEIYAAASLPSEVKSHIIQIGNANTIRLREGSSSNVTILAEDGAITSNGTPGTNTVNIEIEEVSNENVYWLESDGVYYPMRIANSRVVLDKENTSTTEPTGQVSTGNEIGITFLDSGTSEAGENSNYVTKTTSKNENITTITLTSSSAGSTQVIVKKGNGTEVGEKVEVAVTVTPVYTISLGTMTNGSVGIATSGYNTTSNTKYANGTQIVLTATGDDGYTFEKWIDDNSTTNLIPYQRPITVTADGTYTATFKEVPEFGNVDATLKSHFGKTVVTSSDITVGTANWQLLYADSDNLFLIYSDYLENEKIPSTTDITKSGCNVYASNGSGRDTLINYLKVESNWVSISNAFNTKYGVLGITAKGAPTPDMWMASYNAKYGTNLGTKNFKTAGQTYYNSDSSTGELETKTGTARNEGYLYTRDKTTNPIKWETYLSSQYMKQLSGYPTESSNMYYPYTSEYNNCYGYWLARTKGTVQKMVVRKWYVLLVVVEQ